eukprot:SAG22_NODE_269_length_13236_cov_124.463424_7_plen_131_part_00
MPTYLDWLPDDVLNMVYKYVNDRAIVDAVRMGKRKQIPYSGKYTNNRVIYLAKILYNRRHITANGGDEANGVTVWVTTQSYNRIPLMIRKVANGIIAFKLKNVKEIMSIYDEFPTPRTSACAHGKCMKIS